MNNLFFSKQVDRPTGCNPEELLSSHAHKWDKNFIFQFFVALTPIAPMISAAVLAQGYLARTPRVAALHLPLHGRCVSPDVCVPRGGPLDRRRPLNIARRQGDEARAAIGQELSAEIE